MRNLLALFGALVLGFGGVGWYMGWYTFHFSKADDGRLRLEVDADANKVVKDTGEGAKRVGAVLGDQLDKAKADAQPNPGSPVNTPAPAPSTQIDSAKPQVGGWLFGTDRAQSGTKK